MLLKQLTIKIQSSKVIGNADIDIKNIHFDSRLVDNDTLFFATKGTAVDGHDFIDAAIEKGAKAIVCENLPQNIVDNICYLKVENSLEALGHAANAWYDYPSTKLKLTGVTGTNGKTTTATLLYDIFRKLGYKVGLLSTVCNYIDGQAIEATHTTPDALMLNKLLADMVAAGCTHAFMEVSSHAVDQRRIAGLDFDVAIFSNITRDHIDYHGTFENYLKAKKRFFDDLSANAKALTNIDDKNL